MAAAQSGVGGMTNLHLFRTHPREIAILTAAMVVGFIVLGVVS